MIVTEVRRKIESYIKLPILYFNYSRGNTRIVGTYPDRLYIELTNVCNLDCIMCPTGLHILGRKKGYMDFKLFKDIINEMAPHVKTTTLHIWGEPLLHQELVPMINYASKYGIKVSMSTNATLLDEKKSTEILDSGLHEIYLCLDGMKKETYEAIRRRADFAKTKSNIERFLKLKVGKNKVRPYSYVQIIEMGPTKSEIEEFTRIWTKPGVDKINVKAFDAWGNQVKEIVQLRDKDKKTQRIERYHCPLLWYHAHVYWDGTVTCCDRDFGAKYPLGNVVEEGGVMKVWNGEKMAELRRKHLEKDLRNVPPCHKCTEWSWWKPGMFSSRGNAPHQNGSLDKLST